MAKNMTDFEGVAAIMVVSRKPPFRDDMELITTAVMDQLEGLIRQQYGANLIDYFVDLTRADHPEFTPGYPLPLWKRWRNKLQQRKRQKNLDQHKLASFDKSDVAKFVVFLMAFRQRHTSRDGLEVAALSTMDRLEASARQQFGEGFIDYGRAKFRSEMQQMVTQ